MQLISDLRHIIGQNNSKPQSMLLMEPCSHSQLEAISKLSRHQGPCSSLLTKGKKRKRCRRPQHWPLRGEGETSAWQPCRLSPLARIWPAPLHCGLKPAEFGVRRQPLHSWGPTSGVKSALPSQGMLPEMTSRQKSAGFSLGGRRKPRLWNQPSAASEGPRYTVRPEVPSSSTSWKRRKME